MVRRQKIGDVCKYASTDYHGERVNLPVPSNRLHELKITKRRLLRDCFSRVASRDSIVPKVNQGATWINIRMPIKKNFLLSLILGLSAITVTGCANLDDLRKPATEDQLHTAKSLGSPVTISVIEAFRNSANGIDVRASFDNISEKQIKYIYFEVVFTNRVGDIVTNEIGRKNKVQLTAIGPFSPGIKEWPYIPSGYWERIFYSSVATEVKFVSLQAEYFDGTRSDIIKLESYPGSTSKIGYH